MNTPFNGDRLKKARIYRGLTVAELAERVGCQRQTLSMYEINKSKPADDGIVKKLSHTLNFPVKYFYEQSITCASSTTYFRSLLTTSKKYRHEQTVKMDFISQIYSMLQYYVNFPEYVRLNLPEDIEPEKAAYALREAWGLGYGPIDNLVSVVEQHGILVNTFATSTDDVDAFSQLIGTDDASTYIIAYSENKRAAARIHFDIAHELGHICLHEWSEDIESLSKEDFKDRENAANEFAAAFLMPEQTFKKDAENGPHTLTYYKQLKNKWKVSIAAMIRRAKELGVISFDEYQNLIKTLQKRGQRKEEPLDDVLITASPALLKTAVVLLLQENVFTRKEFMDELSSSYGLSIYAADVESLLKLPSGTLAISNIIDFPKIQIKQTNKDLYKN